MKPATVAAVTVSVIWLASAIPISVACLVTGCAYPLFFLLIPFRKNVSIKLSNDKDEEEDA